MIAEYGARSRLGFVPHDGLDARTLGYAFVPPGLTTARQVNDSHKKITLKCISLEDIKFKCI